MQAITAEEFKKLKRERIIKLNDYLRFCNEEQINYKVEMIEIDLRSKYIIKK